MRSVELLPHDPAWADKAQAEVASLEAVLGGDLLAVHHIGSTAVTGLPAKPIIDLIAAVPALDVLERHRAELERIGYRWRGENGLPGRRYFTKEDAQGHRQVHLHIYAQGDPEVARHLLFRDRLRADPALANAYAAKKTRCRELHPDDASAYLACKAGWITSVEKTTE